MWDAAAGLADRDRALLDLHLRQGLEGAELGEAMGVTAANAYTMLNRLRAQVDRSLGALLIARLGRDDCDELDDLLADWDGTFSPLIRKRVSRHVDDCEVCGERRKKILSPWMLLAGVPMFTAPALLRDRVVENTQLVAYTTPTGEPTRRLHDRVCRQQDARCRPRPRSPAARLRPSSLIGGTAATVAHAERRQGSQGHRVLVRASDERFADADRVTSPRPDADDRTAPGVLTLSTTAIALGGSAQRLELHADQHRWHALSTYQLTLECRLARRLARPPARSSRERPCGSPCVPTAAASAKASRPARSA